MPRLVVPVTDRDHIRGPATAPVTLVEYGDFQCPFCGRAFWVLRNLEARYPRDLRVVFRHFPLTEIHPFAMDAAVAAEAAGAQGRFWEMHDILYENQSDFEPAQLVAYASTLGIDIDAFTEDLDTPAHRETIRRDFMSGVRSGVNGTPSLFINGLLFAGLPEEAPLVRAIDTARRERHVQPH